MAVRTDVGWLPLEDRQLILVKRSLYDLAALMTLEEFRNTEPSVEAVAVVTKEGVVPVIMRTNQSLTGNVMETYYAVGKSINERTLGEFAINLRLPVLEDE